MLSRLLFATAHGRGLCQLGGVVDDPKAPPKADLRAHPKEGRAHADATRHLRASDPVMRDIIERVGPCLLGSRNDRGGPASDHYGALVRAIVGQQISTSAARSIYGRLVARYGGRTPTPRELLADEREELRAAAGLSRSKVGFLRDLADHIESGALVLEDLEGLSDKEASAQLTQVKGIGQWTADMFLIFHLGRADVLPIGDLGLRRAAMIEYRLRKLPEERRFVTLARPWRPWRSVACWYLWASLRAVPA
jgi:DNA-3-methyladenine glycosylase II